MRSLWVMLLLLPTSQALTWSDPAGDVQQNAGECTMAPAPPDWYPDLDVVEITLEEAGPSDILLRVQWADMKAGTEPVRNAFSYYGVTYEWAGQSWYQFIAMNRDAGTFTHFFYISDGYEGVAGMNKPFPTTWGGQEVVLDGNTATVTIRKSFFHHADWAPMRAGDAMRNVTPFAADQRDAGCALFGPLDVIVGEPEDLVMREGNQRAGTVFLFSPDPSRGSNGAATTYIFTVEARNPGPVDDVLSLQLGVPPDWVVRAPRQVEAPAGQDTSFAVAVTVPFKHLHGGSQQVDLRATSSAEPGKESELALRVWWTAPAQPGGHHPALYIHSMWDRWASIQTEPDDDGGALRPWDRTDPTPADPTTTYRWRIPLNPSLSVGLDFQPGSVEGTSTFDMPMEATVEATARLSLTGDAPQTLATQSQTLDMRAGQQAIEWALPMADGIDRIPATARTNLALEFELSFPHVAMSLIDGSPTEVPLLMASDDPFLLPLVDYHDIIDDDLASMVATLNLGVDRPERRANPGRAVVFDVLATNAGAVPITVDWAIEGPEAAWGRMAVNSSRIDAGQQSAVALVVQVPDSADDGRVGTLLLIGTDHETGDEYFAKVLVLVTTAEPIPDQAALAPDPPTTKESPAIGIGLGALLLAAMARSQTRRRS